MSDDSIPSSYDPIVQHLEDTADGAHTHGPAIGLVHNSEAKIHASLNALVGTPAGPGGTPPAQPGFKALWNTAQANKSAKTAELRTVCSNARLFTRTCIRSLFPVLGESWNVNWNAAGFTDGSLAVPANPSRETPNVQGFACTAAACEAAVQTISNAQSASNQSNTDSGAAYTSYQNGIKAGRARLSGLRDELSQLIADDNDRWYAFGFDKPSDPSTPEETANLTVSPGAPGSKTLIAYWDDSRRVDNYSLRAVTKSDGQEAANEIAQDSQLSLTFGKLLVGTIILITVTARNAAGESPTSNVMEIAVP